MGLPRALAPAAAERLSGRQTPAPEQSLAGGLQGHKGQSSCEVLILLELSGIFQWKKKYGVGLMKLLTNPDLLNRFVWGKKKELGARQACLFFWPALVQDVGWSG